MLSIHSTEYLLWSIQQQVVWKNITVWSSVHLTVTLDSCFQLPWFSYNRDTKSSSLGKVLWDCQVKPTLHECKIKTKQSVTFNNTVDPIGVQSPCLKKNRGLSSKDMKHPGRPGREWLQVQICCYSCCLLLSIQKNNYSSFGISYGTIFFFSVQSQCDKNVGTLFSKINNTCQKQLEFSSCRSVNSLPGLFLSYK